MGTNEELVERIQTAGEGTPEAALLMAELWKGNVKLVRLAVHRMTGLEAREQDFEDMEQQAYFGFYAAVFSFDAEDGISFTTYVVKRIEWELSRYYERNGFTVRVPAFMRRRLRECAKMRRQLEADTGRAVTQETALTAMGLSRSAITSTLAAARRLETESLDAPRGESGDGDDAALLDIMTDGTNMEEAVIEQVWHRELHALLLKALQDVPEEARVVIVRRYFFGVPVARMAKEYGASREALYYRQDKAFQSIRARKYGSELAEFMATTSEKVRADRLIREAREAVERLRLSDTEKELLVL